MGRHSYDMPCTWQLHWPDVEQPWLALAGPFVWPSCLKSTNSALFQVHCKGIDLLPKSRLGHTTALKTLIRSRQVCWIGSRENNALRSCGNIRTAITPFMSVHTT